jgi:GAF domain-containing protein
MTPHSRARTTQKETIMSEERFLNSYRNISSPPSPDLPPEMAGFMRAVDPILTDAAELARVVAHAHQGAATQLIGEGWKHARKFFSLSEKYAAWADYRAPAHGFGIHAYAHKSDRPLRFTDQEMRAHPQWRNFGTEVDEHPPMRGWLAVPLIGSDGANYGFIQASDRLEGDFTEQDEANLVRLATLTSTALDAVAQLHLPEYRAKVRINLRDDS